MNRFLSIAAPLMLGLIIGAGALYFWKVAPMRAHNAQLITDLRQDAADMQRAGKILKDAARDTDPALGKTLSHQAELCSMLAQRFNEHADRLAAEPLSIDKQP